MSQPNAFDFSNFAPGFDFLKKMASGNPAAPSVSSWVAPTLDPEELERRIKDLRAVQFWLEQNAQAVAATIQALEVQRMTLSALKGMNVSMNELAESLKVKPAPAAAAQPDAAQAGAKAGASNASASKASTKAKAKSAKSSASAGSAAGGVDPMAWWGSLTQQFQQIAGDAMKDMQRKAQAMAPEGTPPGKPTAGSKAAPKAKPAAKSSAARSSAKPAARRPAQR